MAVLKTYLLSSDYVNRTVNDNNDILIFDSGLKIAPVGDQFGDIKDVLWSETQSGGSWTEAGGLVNLPVKFPGVRETIQLNSSAYSQDYVLEVSDTKIPTPSGEYATTVLTVGLNDNNRINCFYVAENPSPPALQECRVSTFIGGVLTTYKTGLVNTSKIKLRIKRHCAPGVHTCTCYYAPWTGAAWGAWVAIVTDLDIRSVGVFDENTLCKPSIEVWANRPVNYDPDITAIYQTLDGGLPYQRFYPKSAAADIIDSSSGAVEYALDAGAGKVLSLMGFSADVVTHNPGTPSFQAGWSETPDRASATWNGTYLTIQQMDALLSGGFAAGHRYLFLKTLMVGDPDTQLTMISCTVEGFTPYLHCAPPDSATLEYFIPKNIAKVSWVVSTPTAKGYVCCLYEVPDEPALPILLERSYAGRADRRLWFDYQGFTSGKTYVAVVESQCRDCTSSEEVVSNEITPVPTY